MILLRHEIITNEKLGLNLVTNYGTWMLLGGYGLASGVAKNTLTPKSTTIRG